MNFHMIHRPIVLLLGYLKKSNFGANNIIQSIDDNDWAESLKLIDIKLSEEMKYRLKLLKLILCTALSKTISPDLNIKTRSLFGSSHICSTLPVISINCYVFYIKVYIANFQFKLRFQKCHFANTNSIN